MALLAADPMVFLRAEKKACLTVGVKVEWMDYISVVLMVVQLVVQLVVMTVDERALKMAESAVVSMVDLMDTSMVVATVQLMANYSAAVMVVESVD